MRVMEMDLPYCTSFCVINVMESQEGKSMENMKHYCAPCPGYSLQLSFYSTSNHYSTLHQTTMQKLGNRIVLHSNVNLIDPDSADALLCLRAHSVWSQ